MSDERPDLGHENRRLADRFIAEDRGEGPDTFIEWAVRQVRR